jgi:hypothetical protein
MEFIFMTGKQGCRMLYFQTKNPDLGNFWMVLQWNILEYYMFGLFFRLFDIICDHLVYFMAIWYIFSPLWYVVPRNIWQPC